MQETVTAPVESTEPEAPAPTESKEPEETAAPAEATPTAEAEAAPVPTVEAEAPAQPEETATPEPTPEVSPEVTPEAEVAAEPTPEAEEEETVIYMPAGTFSGSTSQMTVTVSYDDHTFPTGTTMRVTDVSKHEAIAAAEQSTEGDEEVIDAVAVDITFLNANNQEIQPEGAVSVSMVPYTPLETTETSTTEVIHKDDSGNTQVIDADASAQNATFDADSFSIYVISITDGKQVPAIATYIFHGADNQKVISTQMVKDGETVYAPSTPEKSGYKFLGWSKKPGVSSLQEGDPGAFPTLKASVTVTTEVKLYPVFKQVYYVFFMDNQGRVSTTKEGVSNDEITVSDVKIPLDSTHSVTGWYTEAALTNKVDSVTLTDHNVTLYPKVEQGHYLYFASGEGASYVEPEFVAANERTSAPAEPTRPGYTFRHWSLSEKGPEYSFGSTISENITLHAVWDANPNTKYTVIYWWENANDDNYSYHESSDKSGVSGETVKISKVLKTYPGFDLNTTKTNQSNVTISGDGSTIINIYYSRKIYEVKFFKSTEHWFFNVWYEWNEMENLRISAKYGANISDRWPTSTSKIWGTQKGDNGQGEGPYQSGISTMPLNGAAFYYVNRDGKYTMNLNYYLEGLDGTYYLHHTDSFKSDDNGWKTTAEDHYDIEGFAYTNNVEDGSYFEHVDWSLLYEVSFRYRRNDYYIKFVNGDLTTSEKFKYGADISKVDLKTAPKQPVGIPSDYLFAGWFDNELGVGDQITSLSGTMPANNITLYAKWVAPTYDGTIHLTIEDNGTTIPFNVAYGQTIDENDMPQIVDHNGNLIQAGDANKGTVTVPQGNTWAGWATKTGDGSFVLFNFNTKVHGNITFYPYYINGEKYRVTYNLGSVSGEAPTDSKLYAENSYADIQPATGVTPPEGKTFLYWSHGKDKYYPGDKVKITGNLELTAVYGDTSALTSITYHSNYPEESKLEEETTTVDKQANNTAITLKKAGFAAPTGYYFSYWKDRSGKRYDVGTTIGIDNDNTFPNDLYAVWEQKKEITLTANSGVFTYDGTEHNVSGVKTNTFTIDNVIYTVSGFTTQNPKETNAGTYTNNILNTNSIVVKNGDNDVTYQFTVNTENGSLKITPKAVTVTAENTGKTYGEKDPELTATVSGTLDNDTVSYSLSRAEGENVGDYAITPKGDKDQGNYTVTYVSGTFTISKSGTLVLTANGYEGEYDGNSHAASASTEVTEGTTISYQVGNEEWTTEAPSIKDVGKKTVKVKAENANYVTAETEVTLKVTPKAVTVTAENKSKTYGEKDPELTAQVSGTLGQDTVRYTLSRAEGENARYYAITPSGEASQGNYTVTYVPGTLTITAADISDKTMFTVSQPGNVVYNGLEQKQPVTVARVTPKPKNAVAKLFTSLASFVNVNADEALKDGTDYTLTYSENLKDVGTVTVTVNGLGNYTGTVTRTYQITPAPLKVTTSSAEKVYDGKPLTAGGTLEGLVNETEKNAVKFTVKGSQTEVGSSVNSYEIVWGNIKESNYSLTKVLGTLKVTARPEPSKTKPAASSSASAPVPAPASTRFIPRTAAYPAEGKEME